MTPLPMHPFRLLSSSRHLVALGFAVGAFLLVGAITGLGAQEMTNLPVNTAAPSLRPYWHVFIAYTIVVVLIGGWAISIARRLGDVERRLADQNE